MPNRFALQAAYTLGRFGRWAERTASGEDWRATAQGEERRPLKFTDTTRLRAFLTDVATQRTLMWSLSFATHEMISISTPHWEEALQALSTKARSEMTIMFVNQDDPGHSITVKLTKTTAILTRSTNIDGLATSQVKHFLLRETVPYTRKDRKTGEPIIASYAAGEHSQRTHLEKVEAKAAQSGAKWGAIWGASLGLVGGLVSTWLAFRFGWTK